MKNQILSTLLITSMIIPVHSQADHGNATELGTALGIAGGAILGKILNSDDNAIPEVALGAAVLGLGGYAVGSVIDDHRDRPIYEDTYGQALHVQVDSRVEHHGVEWAGHQSYGKHYVGGSGYAVIDNTLAPCRVMLTKIVHRANRTVRWQESYACREVNHYGEHIWIPLEYNPGIELEYASSRYVKYRKTYYREETFVRTKQTIFRELTPRRIVREREVIADPPTRSDLCRLGHKQYCPEPEYGRYQNPGVWHDPHSGDPDLRQRLRERRRDQHRPGAFN